MKYAALLVAAGFWCFAADAITDESLRSEALRAVFPGMRVDATRKRVEQFTLPSKRPLSYRDAQIGETIYRVVGKRTNYVEDCASDDLGSGRFSGAREVAFRLYPWPGSHDDYVAVLQYGFSGARPAMTCSTIGLVAHLQRRGTRLFTTERALLESQHHWSVVEMSLTDITGDDIEELVVESDFGGPAARFTRIHIFDLSQRKLRPPFEILGRCEFDLGPQDQRVSLTVLDSTRSQASAGTQYCFTTTVFMEKTLTLKPPRVEQRCFPVGLDAEQQSEYLRRQEKLRPLPR